MRATFQYESEVVADDNSDNEGSFTDPTIRDVPVETDL